MQNRITFIINTLKVGGAAKMLTYVANLSLEVFNEVTVVTLYDSEINTLLDPRINIIFMGFEKEKRGPYRTFRMIRKLRYNIEQINSKYICSFVSHVAVITWIASIRLPNTILIAAERADPYTQPLIWKFIIKYVYRKHDYCVFQLENARDFFGRKVANRSFVIPNPYLPRTIIKPYLGARKKTIVSAGRFAWEKDFDVLIKAYAKVQKEHTDYNLILYGEGPCLPEYKKLVVDLNIQNKVFFPGYINNVEESVFRDGIFVLSSFFEGIPNSLIEAMSVGIPVVATDCTPGGSDFLTDHGKRGMLVPVRNVNKMATAISYLINNQEFAKAIGTKGTEIVDLLNEKTIHQQWVNSFNKIINDIL